MLPQKLFTFLSALQEGCGFPFSLLTIICLFIVVIPVCVKWVSLWLAYIILLMTTNCIFLCICVVFHPHGHPGSVSVAVITHLDAGKNTGLS